MRELDRQNRGKDRRGEETEFGRKGNGEEEEKEEQQKIPEILLWRLQGSLRSAGKLWEGQVVEGRADMLMSSESLPAGPKSTGVSFD